MHSHYLIINYLLGMMNALIGLLKGAITLFFWQFRIFENRPLNPGWSD